MDTALIYNINGYRVVIRKRKDGYYTARCFSPKGISIGRTPGEALKKLEETIRVCGRLYHLEVM
ncbi:MAG: hypothetical protein DRP74_02240 [Candidatus Omnitrophota bacterium]|nr:MAG: hypothetical protein DRP74_02240 [Candidatus Omnitrophota bacterium]